MGTTHSTYPEVSKSDHPNERNRSTHKHPFSLEIRHSQQESSQQSTTDCEKSSEASNPGGPSISSAENAKQPVRRRPTHKLSPLDHKVVLALQKLWRAQKRSQKKEIPFTRILLKFPQATKAFNCVRRAFKDVDTESKGYIGHDEVPSLFRKIGVSFSDAEIAQIYEESNLEQNGKLTFKIILISLAIAYLIFRMPLLEKNRLSIFYSSCGGRSSSSATSTKELSEEEQQIRDALQLAVDAFLWFDTNGSGYISRNSMFSQLETSMARHSPTKKLLKRSGSYKDSGEDSANWTIWERRFQEMDWNNNGTIHFNEFLMAFESWVDVDNDDEDDEEDESIALCTERETLTSTA